jgi:hypothetical protein
MIATKIVIPNKLLLNKEITLNIRWALNYENNLIYILLSQKKQQTWLIPGTAPFDLNRHGRRDSKNELKKWKCRIQ